MAIFEPKEEQLSKDVKEEMQENDEVETILSPEPRDSWIFSNFLNKKSSILLKK